MNRAAVPEDQISDLSADLLRLDTAGCEPRKLRFIEFEEVDALPRIFFCLRVEELIHQFV